jgi:hypothetical protein
MIIRTLLLNNNFIRLILRNLHLNHILSYAIHLHIVIQPVAMEDLEFTDIFGG